MQAPHSFSTPQWLCVHERSMTVRNGINVAILKQTFTFFTTKRSCLLDNIWYVNMYNIYIVDMWDIVNKLLEEADEAARTADNVRYNHISQLPGFF